MENRNELRLEKLRAQADDGNVTAIQILTKLETEERLREKREELLSGAQYGRPNVTADDLPEVQRIDLSRGAVDLLKDLDISEIEGYIRRGEFKSLPQHMGVYLSWMELAHDWYYKFKSKNWIVKYLMAVCKDQDGNAISYYLANKIFADQLSFFYSDSDFKRNSWYLYLAERVMMGASMAWEMNDFETYGKNMERAAAILAKITIERQEVDPRLLERRPRFFLTNAKDLGIPAVDRNALARDIDQMALPERVKLRAKRDLGVIERNMLDDESLKGEIEETK